MKKLTKKQKYEKNQTIYRDTKKIDQENKKTRLISTEIHPQHKIFYPNTKTDEKTRNFDRKVRKMIKETKSRPKNNQKTRQIIQKSTKTHENFTEKHENFPKTRKKHMEKNTNIPTVISKAGVI